MTETTTVETQIAETPKTPEQIRSIVLNNIGEGNNTIGLLIRRTGFTHETIMREIGYMKDLFIDVHPGPPIESYWLKRKMPKGRIMLDTEGRATEIKGTAPKKSKEPHPLAGTIAFAPVEKPQIDLNKSGELTDFDRKMVVVFNEDEKFTGDIYEEFMPLEFLDAHPENPRGVVDEEEQAFVDLVSSIKVHGVQEPVIITPVYGKNYFRIVIGHRRCRASIKAGKTTVPVVIRLYDSPEAEEEVMLIENIQRQNLKPTQEAKAFNRLFLKFNEDIHEVARRTGCTPGYISSRRVLLKLDIRIQLMVDREEIGTSAGAAISSLSHEQQIKLLPRLTKLKLDELKQLVAKTKFRSKNPVEQPRRKQSVNRVTTDEEKLTRSGALEALHSIGEAAWVTVETLIESFDDVCQDACVEAKDESFCAGCPVPRMMFSITRRLRRK